MIHAGRLDTFAVMRSEVIEVSVARRALEMTPGPAPMDVGGLGRGRRRGVGKDGGKGRGDGRGKCKGKGKDDWGKDGAKSGKFGGGRGGCGGKDVGKANPDADLTCHYCAKRGHRQADCRKRARDQSGKAAGALEEEDAPHASVALAAVSGLSHYGEEPDEPR